MEKVLREGNHVYHVRWSSHRYQVIQLSEAPKRVREWWASLIDDPDEFPGFMYRGEFLPLENFRLLTEGVLKEAGWYGQSADSWTAGNLMRLLDNDISSVQIGSWYATMEG